MKRSQSRALRIYAESAEVQEYNAEYIGKHESIDGIMAELEQIVNEMTEALDLSVMFVREVMTETAEKLRKISERIHLRIPVSMWKFPMRETVLTNLLGNVDYRERMMFNAGKY